MTQDTKITSKHDLLASLGRLKRLEKMLSLVENSDFFDCLANALDIKIKEMTQKLCDSNDRSLLCQKIDMLTNFKNIARAYACVPNPNYP